MKKEVLFKFYFKYRMMIFPAVVVLSSIFLIIFAIYPQIIELINSQKTAGDLSNKTKLLETKAVALESYNEGDLSQKAGIALAVFPADQDFLNVLGLLQNIAAQSGFNITAVALGNRSNQVDSANSYTVKLELKGARVLFQTLLDNLESSPRLVKIGNIDILSDRLAQSVSVALEVEILYSPVPQNFGTIDSPLPELSQKDEELIALLIKNSAIAQGPEIGQSSPKGKANPFE